MDNKQKPSERVRIIEYQLHLARRNKSNTNYTDMSALCYELANVNFIGGGYNLANFNFIGGGYNISTQNLQGTDSNQPFNAWDNVFYKN